MFCSKTELKQMMASLVDSILYKKKSWNQNFKKFVKCKLLPTTSHDFTDFIQTMFCKTENCMQVNKDIFANKIIFHYIYKAYEYQTFFYLYFYIIFYKII